MLNGGGGAAHTHTHPQVKQPFPTQCSVWFENIFLVTLIQKVKSAGAPYSLRLFTTVYTFKSSRSATYCRCRGSWSPKNTHEHVQRFVEYTFKEHSVIYPFKQKLFETVAETKRCTSMFDLLTLEEPLVEQ